MTQVRSPKKNRKRPARERILEAAITRFANEGIAATQIKAIAADVGVSPALVIHHFGAKEDLREACDRYVVDAIRTRKGEAMAKGVNVDPLQVIRDVYDGPPLMRYLARTLSDASPHVAELIDEMVADAVEYSAEGMRNGILKPTDGLRSRVIVLTMWSLGALMLHEHIERLMGIDILDGKQGWAAWMEPAGEILARGAMEESVYERWREAMKTFAGDQES